MTGKLANRITVPAERETNPTPVAAAPKGIPPALGFFQMGARRLRVVCVDDIVPSHVASHRSARARLVYAPGEVTHFDIDGHRYAVVPEEEQSGEASAPDGAGPHEGDNLHGRLTNRELQIVQLISMGCLTKQVSDRLHISEFTVRSYLKTIYCKLGVRSRGALVYRYAQSFKRREELP
ncbi:MAG: response regulator transcription factor [Betaproteobacteria bacterium]|nr:response regulator transcription factor [Betaproteobacteria bacterium]